MAFLLTLLRLGRISSNIGTDDEEDDDDEILSSEDIFSRLPSVREGISSLEVVDEEEEGEPSFTLVVLLDVGISSLEVSSLRMLVACIIVLNQSLA